jgi:tetratricopeptide (TPR) repeat protein
MNKPAFLFLLSLLGAAAAAPAQDPAARERAIRAEEEKLLRQRRERERREREAANRAAAATRRAREAKQTDAALAGAIEDLASRLAGPPAARVVAVNPQYAIVTGGKNVGAAVGDSMRCFARGEAIVVEGEMLGYDETPLGEGLVNEVRDKLSYVSIRGAAAPAKAGDVCYGGRELGKTALLPLLYGGQRTQLGNHAAERFYQALSSRGVRLVERAQLTRIIAEQKLGDSALFDPANAAHIGSLAGADSLLLGTIDDATGSILLAVRIVRSKDSLVLASQQAELPKNDSSIAMLAAVAAETDAVQDAADQAARTVSLDNPITAARREVAAAERLLEADRIDEALPHFVAAVRLAPEIAEVKDLGGKISRAPARNAPLALKRAQAFITAGRLDDAALAFVEAVRLDPDLPDIPRVAEELRQATDRWDSDIRDTHVRRHKSRGRELIENAEYDGADHDIAAGAALAPRDSEIQKLTADVTRHNPTHRLSHSVLALFGALP